MKTIDWEQIECPEGVRKKAWEMFCEEVKRRMSRGVCDMPLFVMREMKETSVVEFGQGVYLAMVPHGEDILIFAKLKYDFFNCLNEGVRRQLVDAQKDFKKFPFLEGVWRYMVKKGENGLDFNDMFEFKEWLLKAKHWDGCDGSELISAYSDFKGMKQMRELILFDGEKVIPELQKRWSKKIETIYRREGKLVVVTKSLSVKLQKGKDGERFSIGKYTLSVALDGHVLSFKRHRRPFENCDGDMWLSPYIEVGDCEDGEDECVKSMTSDGDGICFGNMDVVVRKAMDAGDIFTVMDCMLQLVDQPDWESQGGYANWHDLAYPDRYDDEECYEDE